jgi:2-C-methyl-D-erythritol 2,4-cyclodiphosphate synthase
LPPAAFLLYCADRDTRRIFVRIGTGRDIHRLAPGRPLVLGGIRLESAAGAVGHSDGDALLHAIIDAMLGAAGLGDIGDHFPDSDPAWKDADSRDLVRRVVAMLAERGLRVAQVDATVVLESPKLGPAKQAMCENIAADLGLAPEMVNVKAKTNEGLDAVGRGEAVAAEAVVMLADL